MGTSSAAITPERLVALRRAAESARRMARTAYSGFLVLAAVEAKDGRVHGGANVEIANYSLTKHAEETAVLVALAGGQDPNAQWLRTLYVAGGSPCGACRQFVYEFASADATFVLEPLNQAAMRSTDLQTLKGQPTASSFAELLPRAFGPDDILGAR